MKDAHNHNDFEFTGNFFNYLFGAQRANKEQEFLENYELFSIQVEHALGIIRAAYSSKDHDGKANEKSQSKLLNKGSASSKNDVLKPLFFSTERRQAWEYIAQYCGNPELEPMLPCIIISFLLNYSKNNIRLLHKKKWNNIDKEKLVNLFTKPQKNFFPYSCVDQWGSAIEKIYQLFFLVTCFYIVLSLPICKNADMKICIEWADKNMDILLDVFVDREKKDLMNSNPQISDVLGKLGMVDGISRFEEDMELIDEEIDKIINGVNFKKPYKATVDMVCNGMEVVRRFINKLPHRFFVFQGNCVNRVISQNQYSEYFFKLFNVTFKAKTVVIIENYDGCLRNDTKQRKYLEYVDETESKSHFCPKKNINNDIIICDNLECENREKCNNGIPKMSKLRLKEASFQICKFSSVETWGADDDILELDFFGFDCGFLFKNNCRKSLILENATIENVSGQIPLLSTESNDLTLLNAQAPKVSGKKILIKGMKLLTINRADSSKCNIKSILNALFGLSLFKMHYYEANEIMRYADKLEDSLYCKIRAAGINQEKTNDVDNSASSFPSLDQNKLAKMLTIIRNKNPKMSQLSDDRIMENMGLVQNGKPTVVSEMLIGEYPQSNYQHMCILARSVPGTEIGESDSDGSRFVDYQHIEGTIIEMHDDALQFVKRNILKKTITDPQTGKEISIFNYPISAVSEAILNALVHREYCENTSPIILTVFSDRLEISNPCKKSKSNKCVQIARILEMMGIIENQQSGIPHIKNEMKKYGLPDVEIENSKDSYTIIFRCPPESIKDDLILFCRVPRTRKEIAEHLNMKSTSYAIKTYIMPLINSGEILLENPNSPSAHNQKYYSYLKNHCSNHLYEASID